MAPKPSAPGAKGGGTGKQKGRENSQVSTIELGLPSSAVVALQSISSRATQDLWGSAAFAADDLSAEQLAQRRTNAAGKLSKRLAGDMKAKTEMISALSTWSAQIGHHLLGLVGRVRAIGSKLDEDLAGAIQEMSAFLQNQPSAATAEQLSQAQQSLGPIWTDLQEQEVIRMAALLKAFGTVQPTAGGAADSLMQSPALSASFGTALSSNQAATFGDTLNQSIAMPGPGLSAPTPSTAAPPSGRWRKRTGTTAQRPSKSPRREIPPTSPPWTKVSTGRTPEATRHVPQVTLAEDEQEELIPAYPPPAAPSAWFSHWLLLATFAVENGGDLVGEVGQDIEQDAILPLPVPDQAPDLARTQAQQAWEALQAVVRDKSEHHMLSMCLMLSQVLHSVRQSPSVLPEIRQGLLLAAHLTAGGVLDPYSYAPATAQEWLHPATLVERGGPFKGYLASSASTAAEVQGLLRFPCPYLPQQVNDDPDVDLLEQPTNEDAATL